MWYRGSVTVEAGTTKADPATAVVEVCRGTVSQFYRLFPAGCAGLVSLQVYYQTRQVFPTTPGQAYIGDQSEVLGKASLDLDEVPFQLELRAWAPDAVYDHTVYTEFYIEPDRYRLPVPIEDVDISGVLSGAD